MGVSSVPPSPCLLPVKGTAEVILIELPADRLSCSGAPATGVGVGDWFGPGVWATQMTLTHLAVVS